MSRVILQPTGSNVALFNTFESHKSISKIKPYIDDFTYQQLIQICPNKKTYICGVKNGVGNRNLKDWNKIIKGDIALIAKINKIFSIAVTTLKLKNSKLAKFLWGIDQDEKTWENIYFLNDIQDISISYNQINQWADYHPNTKV